MRLFWRIIYPVLLYEVIGTAVFQQFPSLGALVCTLISALLSMPLFFLLYKDDNRSRFSIEDRNRLSLTSMIYIMASGVGTCILVNNLLTISRLELLFPGVTQVNDALYAPKLWIQILSMGLAIPVAEELIFRGIVFRRIRDAYSFRIAAVLSAALFGFVHGNVVQGIYALVLGLMMAWVFEYFGTVLAPILFHVAANLCSVLFTRGMELYEVWNGDAALYMMTVLAGILFVISVNKIKHMRKEVLF